MKKPGSVRFDFMPIEEGPSRDAAAYWIADVYDDSGVRYPVRAMVEGLAIASQPDGFKFDKILIEEMYRHEISLLLGQGRLRPQGGNKVNVVFFAEEGVQIQEGDIVVRSAGDRIRQAALRLGR